MVGRALMPPVPTAGPERLAELGEALAHRGHQRGGRINQRAARAVGNGAGDVVRQGVPLAVGVVVQVAAGGLRPQPFPDQRRIDSHPGRDLVNRQGAGSGERRP
jgi:hypothetical protein